MIDVLSFFLDDEVDYGDGVSHGEFYAIRPLGRALTRTIFLDSRFNYLRRRASIGFVSIYR